MQITSSKGTSSIILIIIFLGLPVFVNAQKVVQGIITDKITHKPIPYVSILNGANGTITNSDGEFIITVSQLPANLSVTHLNYQDTTIAINSNEIKLELSETPRLLQEIIISDLGLRVMQSLYKKLIADKSSLSASGFYRQTIVNNKTCTEIIETFNDLTFSKRSISKYKITNGRFGVMKEEGNEAFLRYANFSYLVFGFKPFSFSRYKDDGKSIGIPLMPNADQFYTYQVVSKIVKGSDEILEVYCTPNNPAHPCFEGSYFVNRSSLEILKIDGFIKNDLGSGIDNLTAKIQNVNYTIDMNFMKIDKETSPNYIKIVMNSDLTNKKTGETYPTEIKGVLSVYNYKEKKKTKGEKSVSIKTNDLKHVKNSKYDPQFWINNPVIKRSPLEENIIANFEKNKYFGTFSGAQQD